MNTIASQWEIFSKLFLAEVPTIQHRQMKIAFYAGVNALFVLQGNTIGNSNVSEKAGLAIMDGWCEELVRFAVEIQPTND